MWDPFSIVPHNSEDTFDRYFTWSHCKVCNLFFVLAPECRDIVLEVQFRCMYVRTYMVRIIHIEHAQAMEAENSIFLAM